MFGDIWTAFLAFTGQFVVPDWGSLIRLIPLGLAALVVLYVTYTAYRFATAGPTRLGIRKLPPRTPEGIHMPGPSFAPVLGAFGLFMLVFGMVSGGLWLAAGLAVLVITLLYWGRESLRDYDHVAGRASGHGGIAGASVAIGPGALTPPHGTPPAGVHMPPPSFRPILVALSMTVLVAGLIFGGPALLLGIVAVAVALVGWLRDSGREYGAVEAADRTGHLDLGGAPAWPTPVFATLALIIAGALLFGSGVLFRGSPAAPAAPGASGAAAGAAGGTGAAASAAPSLPAADVTLTAQGIAWVQTSLDGPAGKAFTVAFDNLDAAPHNLAITNAAGALVFKGDIVTGPAVKVYDIPALPAGTYSFVCQVHPAMTGTLTVK